MKSSKIPYWYKSLNIQIINEASRKYSVDPDLIAAIVWVESRGNSYAIRFEPAWKYHYKIDEFSRRNNISYATERQLQSCSFGLMQVMGTVIRELGWEESLIKMFRPKINLVYGCKKIKKLMLKYENMDDVISAYNQGMPKKDEFGNYKNQDYVDQVNKYYSELRENK